MSKHTTTLNDLLMIENPCDTCGGLGRRAYGSTCTWHGGIGGQTITEDVCDRCWGSGAKDRTGANLKHIEAKMAGYRKEHEAQQGVIDLLVQNEGAYRNQIRELKDSLRELVEAGENDIHHSNWYERKVAKERWVPRIAKARAALGRGE